MSLRLAFILSLIVPIVGAGLLRRITRQRQGADDVALVVKLGGSALTHKQTFETLNEPALQQTAQQLSRAALHGRVVLIHGAGSFGHFQAHEHHVNKGPADPRFSWLGFSLTRSSVTRLNALVVGALTQAGLPAVALPPFPRWRTSEKKLSRMAMDELRELLSHKLLPVRQLAQSS